MPEDNSQTVMDNNFLTHFLNREKQILIILSFIYLEYGCAHFKGLYMHREASIRP